MALIDEVKDYLVSNSIGTFGTNLFIGGEPDTPANVVTLYPTGGPKVARWKDRDTPTIQVRVRDEAYVDGWDKAYAIFKLLDVDQDYLATLKGKCSALQSQPMFIGRGKNNEYLFTQNFIWHLIRP